MPTPVSSLLHAATYIYLQWLLINPPKKTIYDLYNNKLSDSYLIVTVFNYYDRNTGLDMVSCIVLSNISLNCYQFFTVLNSAAKANKKNGFRENKKVNKSANTAAAIKNMNSSSIKSNRHFSSSCYNSITNAVNHIKPDLNDSNSKIPWKITSSNIKALKTIIKFYEWLPKTSLIKLFIDNHCNYLLNNEPDFLGQKETNILVTHFDTKTILNNNLLDCAQLKSAYSAFQDPQQSYLYCFINKETKRRYIGSTINPVNRLHNYINSWEKNRQRFHNPALPFTHLQRKGGPRAYMGVKEMRTTGKGFDNYYFYPAFQAPNFLNLFTKLHPNFVLDSTSILILNALSEFNIKLLEQSVISFIKPEINDVDTAVSFTFSSIDLNNYTPPQNKFQSHSISVYDKNGNLFNNYESINQATKALGIKDHNIRWSRNRENYYIYCPKPGLELKIIDGTLNELTTNVPLSHHHNLINLTDDFLNNLDAGLLYVYFEDKKTIYGTFKTASEFAKLHNLNPWQAYRYINKEFLVNITDPATDDVLSVYLLANPSHLKTLADIQDKKDWPVVSIDTAENNFVRYHENPNQAREELSALVGEFELKPTRSFTNIYITGVVRKGIKQNPSKFKNRFILKWFKDFDNEAE